MVASETSEVPPPMIPAMACGAPFRVADQQVLGRELTLDAVERRHPLAVVAEPDDDPPSGEPAEVERVQRLVALEEHVVRHVDDVADRPHPRLHEALLHPRRRRRPS